ncbi:hypothetical protein [Microbulbifer halophilus]|uniref:Lipoprotein n=1 Tax=Microbulbifer halophilus TaxID=453963 RepID=A0ABW5EDK2_9GAMM|nr:hypothetical protein [Microbulbifer halophilus]MCW8127550.1 hypothetical protein [Microbulbifer halophilus]
MRTKGLAALLTCVALACAACQGNKPDTSEPSVEASSPSRLILQGKVSLPLPPAYDEIRPSNTVIIVTNGDSSIGYRTIDKEELKFIGSDKEPYDFFSSAFDNPKSQEETAFIEGLGEVESIKYKVSNKLDFHLLRLQESEKAYITSPALDFAVEVTAKPGHKNYLAEITEETHIE